MTQLATPCGRTADWLGRPYTKETLREHIRLCMDPRCIAKGEQTGIHKIFKIRRSGK